MTSKGWKLSPVSTAPTESDPIKFMRAELEDAYDARQHETEFFRNLGLVLYEAERAERLERENLKHVNLRTRMVSQLEACKQFMGLRGGDIAPIDALLNERLA